MAQRKHLQGMNVDRGPRGEITLERLRDRLRAFAEARDWKQFHTPKNLAIALSVEAGELLEHFQWISGDDSLTLPADKLGEIEDEMADVLLYLVRLADTLNVDLVRAADEKIDTNATKYPVEKSRGSSKKYTEL